MTRALLRVAGLIVLVSMLASCAPLAGPRVRQSAGGQWVVEVRRSVTFEQLAREIYGDPSLGAAIAEVNRLPVAEKVPRGSLLVLPPREGLPSRVADARTLEAYYREGLEAVGAGRFLEGADHFREALRIDPGRLDIQYNLGLALHRGGELVEATRVLEENARARPGHAGSRYALGSVLRSRGAHARALREFEEALEIDRGHAAAAFARASALESLGRKDEAERAWKSFLRRFPEDRWVERARENLARLEQGVGEPAGGNGDLRPDEGHPEGP